MNLQYRIWDNRLKKFVTHNYYLNTGGLLVSFIDGRAYYGDRELVVQRFAGMKDKKGTNIFEGDVVSYGDKEKYTIKFGRFCPREFTDRYIVGFFDIRQSDGRVGLIDDESLGRAEIIGNIFEK